LEFEVCLGFWCKFPYIPLAAWLDDCKEMHSFTGDLPDSVLDGGAFGTLVRYLSDPKFALSHWLSMDGRANRLLGAYEQNHLLVQAMYPEQAFFEMLLEVIKVMRWTQSDITAPCKFLKDTLQLKRAPIAVVPQCSDLEVGRLNLSDFDAAFICSGPFKFIRTLELDKHLHLDEKGQIHVFWDPAYNPGNLIREFYGGHPVWNYQGHNSA
jgi:hypothetical protein